MRVSGAGTSRHPVGNFQEIIIAKKGPESKGISSLFLKFNLFLFNILYDFFGTWGGPPSRAIIMDARGGRFFSQLGGGGTSILILFYSGYVDTVSPSRAIAGGRTHKI